MIQDIKEYLKKLKLKKWCLVSFALCCLMFGQVYSQTAINPVSSVSFRFGDADSQLGTLGAVSDSMSPLFFAFLPDGSIAIPDYYKNRIALFSESGAFTGSIPCEGIISPRMNYFGVTGNGCFVVFNDSVLYCVDKGGTVLWNVPFPMGVFPQGMFAGASEAFFSIMNGDALRGFSVSTEASFELSEKSIVKDSVSIPYVDWGSLRAGYTLGDHFLLNPTVVSADVKATGGSQAQLCAIFGADRILWADSTGQIPILYGFSRGRFQQYSLPSTKPYEETWYWVQASRIKEKTVAGVMRLIGKELVIERYSFDF